MSNERRAGELGFYRGFVSRIMCAFTQHSRLIDLFPTKWNKLFASDLVPFMSDHFGFGILGEFFFYAKRRRWWAHSGSSLQTETTAIREKSLLFFSKKIFHLCLHASDAYESGVDSTRSRLQANFFRLDSTRFKKLKSRLFFWQYFFKKMEDFCKKIVF